MSSVKQATMVAYAPKASARLVQATSGEVDLQAQAQQDLSLAAQHQRAMWVLDLAQVERQVKALQQALPQVALYYAIKACDHPALLAYMHQQPNVGFDLASSGEIAQLRCAQVYTQRSIHTHPVKTDAEIRAALRYGCTTFVVDNPDELLKLKPYAARVGILCRLNCACTAAAVPLAKKFGIEPAAVMDLLKQAQQHGLQIKGLSFHVGSQTPSPKAYLGALEVCRNLFQQAAAIGMPLRVLDIGGGFPVAYCDPVPSIEEFCAPIRRQLAKWPEHVKIIAEPGRFLVAAAARSITQVIAKAKRGEKYWYYLNDGVYGSFSGQIYDGMRYPMYLPQYQSAVGKSSAHAQLKQVGRGGMPEQFPSVLAGPSCDSIDIINEDVLLPELAIGDVVVHQMMGAYTIVSASAFNRLQPAQLIVTYAGRQIESVCHTSQVERLQNAS